MHFLLVLLIFMNPVVQMNLPFHQWPASGPWHLGLVPLKGVWKGLALSRGSCEARQLLSPHPLHPHPCTHAHCAKSRLWVLCVHFLCTVQK